MDRSSNKRVFGVGLYKSSHPEVFLVKRVLKISSKFTVEHPCQSVISTEFFY